MKKNLLFYFASFFFVYNALSNDKILFWSTDTADIFQQGNVVAYRYRGTEDYDAYVQIGTSQLMLDNGKQLFNQFKREFSGAYEPSEDWMKEKEPEEELE